MRQIASQAPCIVALGQFADYLTKLLDISQLQTTIDRCLPHGVEKKKS